MTGPVITFWKLRKSDDYNILRPYVVVYDNMVEIHSEAAASR